MFLGFAYFCTARKLIRLLSGCDLNMKKCVSVKQVRVNVGLGEG